jgi:regulator of RNase E activity RraA
MVEQFKQLYNGVVYDTMTFDLKVKKPFMLRKEIKPMWDFSEVIFGPAFTCKGERVLDESHIDDTVRIKMFKQFYQGCVQVISSGGYRDVAQFGDISGKLARKFGAVGAVLDAPTRDIKLIRDDKFPIFADGIQSTDAYGKWQITEFEVPIIMPGIHGDVEINSGDFVFGDPDGVLIIPKAIVSDVLELAQKRMIQEDLVRQDIINVTNIQDMYDKRGRW